jgi:preprotein translocase subunit SecG
MEVFRIVLYTTVVVIALLLIGLILIQQSKGGGFGSAFSGLSESVFGARAGSHLTKLTVILTSLFFFLTLILAVVTGHSIRDESAIEIASDLNAKAVAEKPVQPVADKPVKAKQALPAK